MLFSYNNLIICALQQLPHILLDIVTSNNNEKSKRL